MAMRTGWNERSTAWRVVAVASALVLVALPWLLLIPMGVWRGIAVIEPCDRKALERFGPADTAFAVRGAEHVQWFPPAWECPLDNGESVVVSPLVG
jgi:hypothetical protein